MAISPIAKMMITMRIPEMGTSDHARQADESQYKGIVRPRGLPVLKEEKEKTALAVSPAAKMRESSL